MLWVSSRSIKTDFVLRFRILDVNSEIHAGLSQPTVGHKASLYLRVGKRPLDVAVSSIGLILLSPVFSLIAILVKITSTGPAFFEQVRVGRNGRPFKLWKFRSMCLQAEELGPSITASGDPRVTHLGTFLRNWKLDELPQLWNVLKGDMSLVGQDRNLLATWRDILLINCKCWLSNPELLIPRRSTIATKNKFCRKARILCVYIGKKSCLINWL